MALFTLLCFIAEHGCFVAPAHGALNRHEEQADRAAHPGMKARVLPQGRREQGKWIPLSIIRPDCRSRFRATVKGSNACATIPEPVPHQQGMLRR
jgi:hypothetical protein